jgi:hypothetical protein
MVFRVAGGLGIGSYNGYYGSFYDTTTQSISTINTAQAVTFNTTAEGVGVSRGTPTSRIVFANAGVYNVQFSAQVSHGSGGGSGDQVYIWLRQNTTDVPQSAGTILTTSSTKYNIASWNYVLTVAANDYLSLMWSVTSTVITLEAAAASSPVPGIPSVILTAVQVR